MPIFKAYDIRGVVPDELDETKAEAIGRAFGTFIGESPIVVGRDMRAHSPSLRDALVKGINAVGIDVIDVGRISTPMLYFAVAKLDGAAAVTVTASHNPAKYNGFKVCRRGAVPIGEDSGLKEIERLSGADIPDSPSPGTRSERDILADYIAHVAAFAEPGKRRLRVVVDGANGMAGISLPGLFEKLDAELIPMYFEPDGSFPNHEANPIKPANLVDLIDRVRSEKADLGASFDGDADRCVFVDETGEPLPGDITTALIAGEFLREKKSAVVYDLRSSMAVREEIEALGGTAIRERVGHSFIKATMREHDAVFAGELSGHYYFKDHSFADCGEIALVKVINLLSQGEAPLSEKVRGLRRYHASGEINFRVEDKDGKIRELTEKFAYGDMDDLDGITARFDGWWFNVRKSNTEPMLRLNLEGRTKALMDEGMAKVLEVLGEPVD